MKLILDHTQRLNLHALLGAHRADVGSIRAIWAVQDEIALNTDEETALELKRQIVGGQERVLWNATLTIPPREIEFTEFEVSRIKAAVEDCSTYTATADRCWLEPVVAELFPANLQTQDA